MLGNFLPLIILMGLFFPAWGWQATFYYSGGHAGDTIDVRGRSVTDCVNTEDYQLCDEDDSCESSSIVAGSVDTHGTCIRVYKEENCSKPLMEIRPGTVCHYSWSDCKIRGEMKSIGGCPSLKSDFDQNTKGIIPHSTTSSGNISSTNFPREYSDDENKNWVVSVPYGRNVQISFVSFEIESCRTDCACDKLTISELISQRVIYEGCGDTLPSQLVSSSNQVRINFKSDGSVKKLGFDLRWKSCSDCEPTNVIATTSSPAAISISGTPNITRTDVRKRAGTIAFFSDANFSGFAYEDNFTPGCHEIPPYFRQNIKSINNNWKTICIHSERKCVGESLTLLGTSDGITNLEGVQWHNKIDSWQAKITGQSCY